MELRDNICRERRKVLLVEKDMSKKLNILERFLIYFNDLKNATNGDPKKLTNFYKQINKIKEAADNLFTFINIFDFERRVFHGPKKYIPQSPNNFNSEWNEYKEKWESPLFDCIFYIDDLISDLDNIKGESTASKQESIDLYPPDPKNEEYFDVLHHDGGKAFEMAFWVTETYADEVETEFADTIHFASKIGLEAYDYLKNTIGFDAAEAFRRWRQIPTIFMPAHVSNRHGFTERGSIYELLDDAIRAYVFGASAAAIAMCRAILETILKEHYNLEFQYKDRKGRLRDKGLGDLIILANEKYEFIQGKRLKKLTDYANKIMHRYSRSKNLEYEDEKIIIEFFKTIKFLIERAPNR